MTVSDIAGVDLRRLHPLTPLFRSWRLVAGAGAIGFGVFRDEMDKLRWFWDAAHGDIEFTVVMKGAMVVVAVALVSVVAGWLSWRVTGFAIVEDDKGRSTLLFHRGLFVKHRRQVRLDRVQAVDVNQPMVPRLAGLAVVQIDMAAGDEASVDLAYLSQAEAWALRAELLRHTGAGPSRPTTDSLIERVPSDGSVPPPREFVIAEVSAAQVIKANLLDGVAAWALAIVWLVGLVVVALAWGTTVLVAALSGIIPVSIAIFAQTRRQVRSMLRDSNFRLTRTPTGIRISSGLTSTLNKTVDLERIQGVRVIEPYLWRRFGWARVMVDVAGGKGNIEGESGVPLMPVADRAVALDLVRTVTGARLDDPEYRGAGDRARKLDPLSWSYLGVAMLADGVVRRKGRWRRSTSYVPYARVQSVSANQGPLQRKLGLATLHLDLPSGAERWTAEHRGTAEAAGLVPELGKRAREHRMAEDTGRAATEPGRIQTQWPPAD